MKTKIEIFRFNSKKDSVPYFDLYKLNYKKNAKVLDVLLDIFFNYDSSISFDYCCKTGTCGLCGVMVNKKPILLCKEPIAQHMVIEPLCNFKVIKDLIVDRDHYKERLNSIQLFLDKLSKSNIKSKSTKIEIPFTKELKYASRCIECFCCLAVCPVYTKNPQVFSGPAGLVQEALYFFNLKIQMNRKSTLDINSTDLCLECGQCSSVCPVQANPLLLIKKMKQRKKDLI